MINHIKSLKSIGLFHETPTEISDAIFKEVTLIYGENGRGKSTFSSIFSAFQSGSPEQIERRRTLGAHSTPNIVFALEQEEKFGHANGKPFGSIPEVAVFDTNFIARNVHVGSEVTPDNRKNLLHFVIGDAAVKAQQEERKQANISEEEKKLAALAKEEIINHSKGISFELLNEAPKVADVDEQLQRCRESLEGARAQSAIGKYPHPASLTPPPDPNFESLDDVLKTSLSSIERDAESAVLAHIAHHPEDEAKPEWIAKGIDLIDDTEECPFCGQPLSDVELIRMYQSYFNTEYQNLKKRINGAKEFYLNFFQADVIDRWEKDHKKAEEDLSRWSDHIDITPLPPFDKAGLASALSTMRKEISQALTLKSSDPAQAASGAPLEEAKDSWNRIKDFQTSFNNLVNAANRQIISYREEIAKIDIDVIEKKISSLEASRLRHEQEMDGRFKKYKNHAEREVSAKEARKQARDDANELMRNTLAKFQGKTNIHLRNLGANFKIADLTSTYRGNSARSAYALELMGHPVQLDGEGPNFSTTLSEADKRTLAFAFFAAVTLNDPNLGSKIVVVDDPMSSLDRSRRKHTLKIITDISSKARQVILLAHDADFLVSAMAQVPNSKNTAQLEICRNGQHYSTLATTELSTIAQSNYYANYKCVRTFRDGGVIDTQYAAIAVRPLLEGYLVRRFPHDLSLNDTIGDMINKIKNCPADSPLVHAKQDIENIDDLRVFGNDYHHDSAQSGQIATAEFTETLAYAKRLLDLIHGAPEPES